MDKTFLLIIMVALMLVCIFWYGIFVFTGNANAQEASLSATVRWNCTNFHTSVQPKPLSFQYIDLEGWVVPLEDGSVLYGKWIGGGFMKWTLDDMWWMTDGYNVVYCEPDIKAISILLAK